MQRDLLTRKEKENLSNIHRTTSSSAHGILGESPLSTIRFIFQKEFSI
jgi:hypothetical protein